MPKRNLTRNDTEIEIADVGTVVKVVWEDADGNWVMGKRLKRQPAQTFTSYGQVMCNSYKYFTIATTVSNDTQGRGSTEALTIPWASIRDIHVLKESPGYRPKGFHGRLVIA